MASHATLSLLWRALPLLSLSIALLVPATAYRLPAEGLLDVDAAGLGLADAELERHASKKHLRAGGVALRSGQYEFVSGEDPGGLVVTGSFLDARHTPSNWGQLRLQTNGDFPDDQQMYAAGYLEGWLTAERILQYHNNFRQYFIDQVNDGEPLDGPINWLAQQDRWVRKQIEDNSEEPFWVSLALILRQLDGLAAGYKARAAADGLASLNMDDFRFLQAASEMYDIIGALNSTRTLSWRGKQPREFFNAIMLSGKCSGLVKVTGDLSELLIGHSTWDTYTSNTRIFKHYNFSLASPANALTRVSFSSYPGLLTSSDDFYMTSTRLVIISTTLHLSNDTLFQLVTPQASLTWQRCRVANALSRSGQEWARWYATHNSGTYNNQIMVVSLDQFSPREELRPGLLWVVEQIPGLIHAEDMTETLERGYWPSYNIPYFPDIYKGGGLVRLREELNWQGPQWGEVVAGLSYQLEPRAKIYRRDHARVADVDSLKRLMRYNDYKNDPYSGGSPVSAICSRGDLDPLNPLAKGCFDSKVTSYAMASEFEAEVIDGPTTYGDIKPFRWADTFPDIPHEGQPESFDFSWERQRP